MNSCCLLCAGPSRRDLICPGCRQDLPGLARGCRYCAVPLTGGFACPACLRRPPPYTARAAFRYDYPLTGLIQRLKFRGQSGLGHVLGRLMMEQLAPAGDPPQALLPMPLHWRRQLGRGFNQALELARPLAAGLSVPLRHDLCRRVKPTRPQSDLPRSRRHDNVRQAFRVDAGGLPMHVVVIDDVMTSGQTATALAYCLRRAGVETIEIWTLARAGLDQK